MGGRKGRVRRPAVHAPVNAAENYTSRLLIGTATLGHITMDWHNAVAGMVIPTNFSSASSTPRGFRTPDAQNLIVQQTLEQGYDWLLLLEDDVVPPPDLFLKLRPYCESADIPMVSGLYYLKSSRREPMMFRGRGNGSFHKWTPGEKVWVDGVPTGCLLVSAKLLRVAWETAEPYVLRAQDGQHRTRRVFEDIRMAYTADTGGYRKKMGTSDLVFCDRVIKDKLLSAAGWPQVQRRRYPFLVDTSIACGHIDRQTFRVY